MLYGSDVGAYCDSSENAMVRKDTAGMEPAGDYFVRRYCSSGGDVSAAEVGRSGRQSARLIGLRIGCLPLDGMHQKGESWKGSNWYGLYGTRKVSGRRILGFPTDTEPKKHHDGESPEGQKKIRYHLERVQSSNNLQMLSEV